MTSGSNEPNLHILPPEAYIQWLKQTQKRPQDSNANHHEGLCTNGIQTASSNLEVSEDAWHQTACSAAKHQKRHQDGDEPSEDPSSKCVGSIS